MDKFMKEEIVSLIQVPRYVAACASAVRYDLLHGPAWARFPIGGGIEDFTEDDFATFPDDLEDEMFGQPFQVFPSLITETLRDFIDSIPSLYWEDWSGCVLTSPDDEDGEGEAPEISRGQIIEALFGKTIAKEF